MCRSPWVLPQPDWGCKSPPLARRASASAPPSPHQGGGSSVRCPSAVSRARRRGIRFLQSTHGLFQNCLARAEPPCGLLDRLRAAAAALAFPREQGTVAGWGKTSGVRPQEPQKEEATRAQRQPLPFALVGNNLVTHGDTHG